MEFKETIQKQVTALETNLVTLRGTRATLEQQLDNIIGQIGAVTGAIEQSKLYLQELEKDQSPQQVDKIDEDAIRV